MDWLTIADHSITDIMRRNFPDLTVTLLELVVPYPAKRGFRFCGDLTSETLHLKKELKPRC